jgi:hypothetical protein
MMTARCVVTSQARGGERAQRHVSLTCRARARRNSTWHTKLTLSSHTTEAAAAAGVADKLKDLSCVVQIKVKNVQVVKRA